MRSRKAPPSWRASSQARSAVRALPRCMAPVGLGAYRPRVTELRRELGPVMLWGLGVGYVISGMYFGWNLGLPQGGTLGLAIATVCIIILYITFTFSYTELACPIPKSGG